MSQVTTLSYKAKKISPMLAAADLKKTLGFYCDVLGFRIALESPRYCVVERDGLTVHFMQAASQHVLDCVRGHTEIYLEVSGIHALWEHVKTYKSQHKIRELFDREYGMTEFHIEDPNGCLVFVGEPTAKKI